MQYLYEELIIPQAVSDACASSAMQRLKGIDMNCGMNYTSFPLFCGKPAYTRYEHSVGVSLLIYRFTKDLKQSLAGLFHDIATPAFSHVVDFMSGDHMRQEMTEESTGQIIRSDAVIAGVLTHCGLSFQDVDNYHRFPIADNDSPKLSCDRLEYTLGNAVNYGFEKPSFVMDVINDLTIIKNESGEEELAFRSPSAALRFADTALACGRVYSGDENRFCMEYLARLLRKCIQTGSLSRQELLKDEAHVISRILSSPYAKEWEIFRRFNAIVPADESDGLNLDAKRRYIDPLVISGQRASAISRAFREKAEAFQNESYDRWLKGICE